MPHRRPRFALGRRTRTQPQVHQQKIQQKMRQQQIQQQIQQQHIQQQIQQQKHQQQNTPTFKIQTTAYLLNIANALKTMLNNMGLTATVMSSEEIAQDIKQELSNVHYIFLCIGHVFHIPKSKYYIYNLEQVNYHPDFPLLGLVGERAKFLNAAFINATTIFDYSEMNITNYPEKFKNKELYLPVPLFEGVKSKITDIKKEYDILFFGGLNYRRQKILKYLEKNTNMNVRIITNVFGDALYDIVKKSRIVLNIHFKGESLLETARIHDCIRHSTPLIISEESTDKSTMEEYKDIVKFIPVIKEDLSNINELTEGIQNLLSNGDICYSRWTAESNMHDMIKKRFDYFKIYKYPSLSHKYLNQPPSPKLFNILIRNTYRPRAFKKCIESVLNQTHKNVRIICCYDDKNCDDYLYKYKKDPNFKIFKTQNVNKTKPCFYNPYCNELLDKVEDGWILFLDDDDMFASNNALETMNFHLSDSDSLLLWKFQRPDKLIYPNLNKIQIDTIASCGYCFHSKHKDLSRWTAGQGGDYNYMVGLLQKHKFKRIAINQILTKTTFTDMRAGSWGKKEKKV